QRLRDERGLAVSVASLRRYVAANLPEEARRAQVRVRVLSLHPAVAGEQAQIDYGQLGRWADPVTGRLRAIWAPLPQGSPAGIRNYGVGRSATAATTGESCPRSSRITSAS